MMKPALLKKLLSLLAVCCLFPIAAAAMVIDDLPETVQTTSIAGDTGSGFVHTIRNSDYVILRAEPALESAAVCTIRTGDKLKLLETRPAWRKVQCSKGTGWLRERYFQEDLNEKFKQGKKELEGGTSSSGPVVSPVTGGVLKAEDFGYPKRYQPVYDLVAKFCEANEAYDAAKGHKWQDGYAKRTDCSGFTGSFYQKLAALSGVNPAYPRNSWYPSSQVYKTKYTKKITSAFPPPNPRDLIKPGDIFVLNPASNGIGHIGVFMGYDKAGNPLIAHSTPGAIKDSRKILGHTGKGGVRIENLLGSQSTRSRWAGVFRINGTDAMLDRLASN